MTFPERFQTAMDEAGLSANDVARDICVRRQSVYRWQKGASVPRFAKQKPLARLLAVHVEWLMFGKGEQYVDSSMIKLMQYMRKHHISEKHFFEKTNIGKEEFDVWHVTNIIPKKSLSMISELYQLDLNELCKNDDPTTTRILMPDEDALLSKYQNLSDEQKKAAQTVLDALAQSVSKQNNG